MNKDNLTVVICSSTAFYKHVNAVAVELEKAGVTAVVPKNAEWVAKRDDYNVSFYKTWHDDESQYHKKAEYMREHFDKITEGDIVLIVNDEKYGQANYIGPNVLMEMSLGWYQNKPLYILNDLPADSPFEEEIKGFMPIVLNGDLSPLIVATKR